MALIPLSRLMKLQSALATTFLSVVPVVFAQSPQPMPQADPVKIYAAGPGITSPELLPHPVSEPYVSDHCSGNQQGKIFFSLIVDAGGKPRNIFFLQPL